jgi:hypothetical protein
MTANQRRSLPFLVLIVVLGLASAGCAGGGQPGAGGFPMADLAHMPHSVQSAPVPVREAYQFAVANPEVLKALPCYCGCGAMGHTSNYDCYVAGVDGQTVTYDEHALGCSICVDITQDAMRLLRQGQSVDQIREYVDANYARYGPSNIPEG